MARLPDVHGIGSPGIGGSKRGTCRTARGGWSCVATASAGLGLYADAVVAGPPRRSPGRRRRPRHRQPGRACPRDHRLHHRGQLGIIGNADGPDGLVFTDADGRVIDLRHTRRNQPPPPSPARPYQHPLGERLQHWALLYPDPPRPAADCEGATMSAWSKKPTTSRTRGEGSSRTSRSTPCMQRRSGLGCTTSRSGTGSSSASAGASGGSSLATGRARRLRERPLGRPRACLSRGRDGRRRSRNRGVGVGLVHAARGWRQSCGCEFLHEAWDEELRTFCIDACGFAPTLGGLMELTA